jgi:hypothetical protein
MRHVTDLHDSGAGPAVVRPADGVFDPADGLEPGTLGRPAERIADRSPVTGSGGTGTAPGR